MKRVANARIRFAAALAALTCSTSPAETPFSFDDIHYWVGEGANRAALVVDFSRDGAAPLAWGFRWNGEATVADALRGIVHEDSRLHALAESGKKGLSLYALGYDRADAAAAFRFDYNDGDVVAQTSDSDAFAEGGWNSGYWCQWTANVGDAFDAASLDYGGGFSSTALLDSSWHVLQFQRPEWGRDTHPLSGEPVAAESPYAWRVVAADVLAGGDYGDPENALGGPTRTVPSWGAIPPTTVNPASPAWGPGRLVTLESASDDDDAVGSITLEFDHPVLDDPRNPFGLDFIVFGNALQTLGGNAYFDGVSDPATVVFKTDTAISERGLVEVSADGTTWFAFTDGPWADDFAPTMGFRYDPENPDHMLFASSAYTNEWWGAPADATRPVDPSVSAADFKGRSLAEYAMLYDGSAGGTGFDISGFDLPRDAQGRKFIRFVRITTCEPGDDTDVDAVADVSPAPSFRNWVDAHVPFADRPGYAKATVCANGLPAYVNAALGLAPDAPGDGVFAVSSFAVEKGAPVLQAPLAPFAYDLVRLRWSESLATPAERWGTALPLWHAELTHAEGTEGNASLVVPDAAAPDAAAFYRIELDGTE